MAEQGHKRVRQCSCGYALFVAADGYATGLAGVRQWCFCCAGVPLVFLLCRGTPQAPVPCVTLGVWASACVQNLVWERWRNNKYLLYISICFCNSKTCYMSISKRDPVHIQRQVQRSRGACSGLDGRTAGWLLDGWLDDLWIASGCAVPIVMEGRWESSSAWG